MRQRILTKHTFETSLGIGSLYEKLFITTDVDPSEYEMRLEIYKEKKQGVSFNDQPPAG